MKTAYQEGMVACYREGLARGHSIVFSVVTSSMYPLLSPRRCKGVTVRACDPTELRPGDMIAYEGAQGTGKILLVHRICRVVRQRNGVEFVTKGDANPCFDQRTVSAGQVLGVVTEWKTGWFVFRARGIVGRSVNILFMVLSVIGVCRMLLDVARMYRRGVMRFNQVFATLKQRYVHHQCSE